MASLATVEVSRVHGVGERRRAGLEVLGIESVLDLLLHYPRRYIDRTRQAEVGGMVPGEQCVVLAEVAKVATRRLRGGRFLVELDVSDGSGSLRVTFFNQVWRAKQLPVGTQALFFGRLELFRGRRQFTNPVVDLIGNRTGRVVPLYPTSEKAGIAGWEIGSWVEEAIGRAGHLLDPLPEAHRLANDLMARHDAVHAIHLPESMADVAPARRRLAFDELLRLQLEVVLRRRALERDARGIRHVVEPHGDGDLVARFVAALPFALTSAQERAVAEIRRDLGGALPMHRLLQGDVGSGKTVVALCALLTAVQGGHQGALMAPTEVLAEQHAFAVRALLGDLSVVDAERLGGVRPLAVALLTSRSSAKEREAVVAGLAAGSVDLVVGTHALLTEDVRFRSLGVVVIDEQHRFGVEQRAALRAKGRAPGDGAPGAGSDPDLLVMTATPIPRTAAMVVFGDLDLTVLDELPAGRSPIETVWARTPELEAEAWARVRSEVEAGHRAFVVCPLVEGSTRIEAKAVTTELERLAAGELEGLALALLHGQLRPAEKEQAMERFRKGDVGVLVATTVIEVGVDVPEATVMVVEDADRFGIAQLHQLRGRVGRSDRQSWCFLLGGAPTDDGRLPVDGTGSEDSGGDATARLRALEGSNDGFDLADIDLELRGEGTVLGARQKGRSDLKLASLRRTDRALVLAARQVAESIVNDDPELARHALLREELDLLLRQEEAEFLAKS